MRRVLLSCAAAGAIAGVLAGLARLDVLTTPAASLDHGPMLVLGVFVTVIALERAVALGSAWAMLAPTASAAFGLMMLAGQGRAFAALSIAAAALLAAVNLAIVRKQSAPFTWGMLAASIALAIGNVAWTLGTPTFAVVPTWMAFFVLTIAAERLELSRLAPTPRWAMHALSAIGAAIAITACVAIFDSRATRVLGVLLALAGLWQIRFDLARRTVRRSGLPRYSAIAVLVAAAWMVVAGALLAIEPLATAGPRYDAALHAIFVGYVLSMVFAHAPIILPAVARVSLPYHPALYVPLALLHASLAVRFAGDLASHALLRQIGASGNALALVAFAAAFVYARVTATRRTR